MPQSPTEPVEILTCQGTKSDGTPCRRRIPRGARVCYQHAVGLKAKWHALPTNKWFVFCIGIVSVGATMVGWIFPDFWKKQMSIGPSKSVTTVQESEEKKQQAPTSPPSIVPAPKDQRKRSSAASAAQNERPPTLMDLFNQDFSGMPGLTDKGFDLRSSGGETIHVNWRVVLDFSARTDFVAFYIPSSEHEAESCLTLANSVRPMIGDLAKRIEVTGGDSGGVTSFRELIFSGRVFIYHEWPLSNKQKADIIEAYSANGLDVQFRGIDYLGNKVITWRQEHDAKAAH